MSVPSMADVIRAAKAAADPGPLADAIPYGKWLGVRAELRDGALHGRLVYSDMLVRNPALPALHGGTIGALLESTAIFEILWAAESMVLPKTINLTIDYMRSGRPTDVWARATVTKHGRRVTSMRVDAWQDDPGKLIASALGHFLVLPADGAS